MAADWVVHMLWLQQKWYPPVTLSGQYRCWAQPVQVMHAATTLQPWWWMIFRVKSDDKEATYSLPATSFWKATHSRSLFKGLVRAAASGNDSYTLQHAKRHNIIVVDQSGLLTKFVAFSIFATSCYVQSLFFIHGLPQHNAPNKKR